MRLIFGNPPAAVLPVRDEDPGKPFRQPGRWASAVLATLAGMILLAVPVTLSIAYSYLVPDIYPDPSLSNSGIPWAGMILVFFLCILAHELLHALLHPDFGRSDSTVLFINWKRLQFGVYYEGRIPRARWILMRLFPILVLTVLPLTVFLLTFLRMTYAVETYLIIVIITNSLGSGGDLAAVGIVLWQMPASGILNFYRGKAYWKPAENQAAHPPAAINTGKSSVKGDRS